VLSRQRSVGSGAIIDAEGYIVTNAHVVSGVQQIDVVLHDGGDASSPLQSLGQGRTVSARLVGVAEDIDLALLKVDGHGFPVLPMANYDRIRQGQLVFAFGNPEGLRNSVTMGLISSVARQIDPDSASVYIQTDAPINPGNSGGPLVNADGEIVGLNTFILSESGGSQGLGFAIPSSVIVTSYAQLRKFGHLHRGAIGIAVQTITPPLSNGLQLTRTSGVVVSDVVPDAPADKAGVKIGDIITSVNGRSIDSVPVLTLALGIHQAGETVTVGLVRGAQALTLTVPVIERPHEMDELTALADPDKNAVPKLGIIGLDLDDRTRDLLPDLRMPTGVLVTARRGADSDSSLMAGDVIHAMNTYAIHSLDGLQVLLDGVKPNTQIILQVERDGHMLFVPVTIY
jgi:serine protease Do